MGQKTLRHRSRVTAVSQVIPWVWALLLVLWGLPACGTLPAGTRGERGDATPPPRHVPEARFPYQESWAVVVGINGYRHTAIPSLNYAIKDAESVAAALQPLGFPRDHITVLTNAGATKAAIEEALYHQVGAADRLLVFFAGHGVSVARSKGEDEGFLLPYDADPASLPRTAISMEDLRRIGTRIAAKHILFVVDACHSGFSVTRGDLVVTSLPPDWFQVATRESVVEVLTAGRKGEKAGEAQGHGIFTTHFLKGLDQLADSNYDKVITTSELFVFIAERVRRDSEGKQNPQYGKLYGEGEFLFLLPGFERPAESAGPPAPSMLGQRASLPPVPTSSLGGEGLVVSPVIVLTCDAIRVKQLVGGQALMEQEEEYFRTQCQPSATNLGGHEPGRRRR